MRKDIEDVLNFFEVKTFGNKKNIERLQSKLSNDEIVLYISPTNAKVTTVNTNKQEKLPGIFALTNCRIIFLYKVLLNETLEQYSLDEIKTITCKGNGLTGGHVEIDTLTKTYDILVSYKKDLMEKIQSTFINAKNEYIASKSHSISISSIPDEIMKYKKLLDNGAITENEYNEKKKELLKK